MLGISVYLGDNLTHQIDYIKKMSASGFTSIFTSLHIPEDNQLHYGGQLKKLAEIATDLNMELMADISPDSLKMLGFDWENAHQLLDWGVTGLRIDYGVDEQTIINLSQKMKIALNASTISLQALRRMKENGLIIEAVEAWHNFYPRSETGLGMDHFIKRNKMLSDEGLTVMAFIPGDESLRGPLFQKLPTLEKHRHCSPFVAYMEMKHAAFVEKIFIGDRGVKDATLAQFKDDLNGIIRLRATAGKNVNRAVIDYVGGIHTNRADFARDCIRSVESRHYAAIGEKELQPENCLSRPAGTITIDNVNYLRYQGEIQVTVNDLPADDKVNVLGQVIAEDRLLLKWIQGNQKFKIDWI